MISIVVCSVSEVQFQQFSVNVAATVGVVFEIIRIDNSSNRYSICSAYNEGAGKAQYPIICFSHEDIILRTQEWGKKVVEIFGQHPGLGVLGIAGSTYKAYSPSGWGIIPELRYVNLIQHYKSLPFETQHDYQNPQNQSISPVVCVDGVWMCTTKAITEKISFDEETLRAFHCYDLDFCLSVSYKYTVAVTFDILLEHLSEGKNDRAWIDNTMIFHRKWKHQLPVNISTADFSTIREQEYNALYYFMVKMVENGCSVWQIMRMLTYNSGNPAISSDQLLLLRKMTIKGFIKRTLQRFNLVKALF
jgi:hypothetical protein